MNLCTRLGVLGSAVPGSITEVRGNVAPGTGAGS